MRKNRWLAVAMLVALAGCGGTDSPATGAEPAGGEQGFDTDAEVSFTYGTNGGSNYDPHTAANPGALTFLYPAYDRLINIDADGGLSPMLATGWELTEDGSALVLDIRDGVTFHDGAPLDAAAVAANLNRARQLETSTLKADLATVSEVTAEPDGTVKLALTGPSASLPALLADRAGMMISPAAFSNPDLPLKPVGAGAYEVTDHQPGVSITYERYADYWEPDAQSFQTLTILMQLDPDARLRALQTCSTDATSLEAPQIEETGADFTVEAETRTAIANIYLNKSDPLLAKPEVRRALSLGIDREGISEALHNGSCAPSSQPFPEGYFAHNPDLETDAYDPEAARALLADADAASLSIDAIVVNVPFFVSQAEAVQAQLREIGVEMNLTPVEPAQLLNRFAIEKSADAYFTYWPGAVDPAKTVASLYLGKSLLNPGGYSNPEVEQLAVAALEETDQAARGAIYQDLAAAVAEDTFHLTICHPQTVYGVTAGIEGLRPNLANAFDFRGVGKTQ